MEQKKNKLLSDMIQNDTDKKMVQLVEAATDLSCGDICTLLEVAHSLPFVGNLEGGDTYINVLTREKESMVIAQYRHPNYDLYKRSIIGEIERREDEPAVYRALEEGISGRGLIGIIDEGRTVVRHTVSPILNSEKKVIGALTYEYPNAGADTESIRIINNQEGKQDPFNRQLGKASDYLQDAILLYDANGICTFVNPKAEVLYQDKGFELPLIGRRCSELHITDCNWSDLTEHRGVIRREVRTPNFIMDAVISGIWENGTCQGAAIIFRDKTVVHQMENKQNKGGGLNKSLKLIFVYTVATGSIFTFVNYWDSVFYGYCGSGTFLAFALMTVAILPVALVYSELASLFHTSGGELIYNTVGINKHVGFLASWLIMAAWISVPPAVVMAIMTWVNKTFALGLGTWQMVGCAAVLLVLYFFMSIQNVQFLVKAQAGMLFCNITVTILTGFILLFSGHWHISNFGNIFQSTLDSVYGIPGWVIGMALLITPYFGFETVPQMVEEGDFPIKSSKKAICGSILTCGCIYVFYYFCVAGLDGLKDVYTNFAQDGFLTIATMQNVLGWTFWPIIVGILSCLLGMGASLLGFWMSTVRMLYSMANKNFLPKVFAAVNKNQQPMLPNVFLLVLSLIFIVLQNSSDFMSAFFNLMSFGCACAYALTMISAVCIHRKHPDWKSSNTVKGGDAFRLFAMCIAVAIAFFCTLGQGIDSWICFGVYLGVGVVIWLWMVLVNWKKHPVEIETPDGIQKF